MSLQVPLLDATAIHEAMPVPRCTAAVRAALQSPDSGAAVEPLRTVPATAVLARPDAGMLAIPGTGVRARSHARAVPAVRPSRELRPRLGSPDPARRGCCRRAGQLDASGRSAGIALPGRSSPTEPTLFKSVGLAVEDAAAAALMLEWYRTAITTTASA